MKTCPECGKECINLGSHMKAHRSKDGVQAVVQETPEPETPKERPLERFGNGRFVFGGGAGMIRR